MKLLIRLLITALLAYTLANIMSGVHVNSFWTAIVFAIVLAVLNVIVKPILILLTLPLTIFTLGLFLLVINTLVVLLASKFVGGFTIDSFGAGFLFSLILSIVSFLISREERKRRD
ncbi:MAG TPA: phage holin family protein [Chitinophagaceae bacterium]|jgi:Predicted membrane protein